jgi:hypothetical protein
MNIGVAHAAEENFELNFVGFRFFSLKAHRFEPAVRVLCCVTDCLDHGSAHFWSGAWVSPSSRDKFLRQFALAQAYRRVRKFNALEPFKEP